MTSRYDMILRKKHLTGMFAGTVGGLVLLMPAAHAEHPLTIDDVMGLTTLSQVSPSPDGELVASVMTRPADESGVYGRTFYEKDPGRADVWITSTGQAIPRNLTNGGPSAAGFWCTAWSPDGQRLAMLSTRPEGSEPRGGDNVRLYVWDRRSDTISRLSDAPIFAQTMGGSSLYKVELRGGAAGNIAHTCGPDSNAPFLWLDNDRLLAMAMPEGTTSGLLDSYSHGLKHSAQTLEKLRVGKEPTMTAVGSGEERIAAKDTPADQAQLLLIDAGSRQSRRVSTISYYPFRSKMQLFVSPDRKSAAVMATTGTIQPQRGDRFAYPFDAWAAEKRLGFIDLAASAPVRWIDSMPAGAPLPLDLLSWSPDSQRIAFRARSNVASRALTLFAASREKLGLTRMTPPGLSIGGGDAGSDNEGRQDLPVYWVDDHRLIARAIDPAKDLSPFDWYRASLGRFTPPRMDWWLLSDSATPYNLTASAAKSPTMVWRAPGQGKFRGIGDGKLWSIDITHRRTTPVSGTHVSAGASLLWTSDLDKAPAQVLIASRRVGGDGGELEYQLVQNATGTPTVQPIAMPSPSARFKTFDPAKRVVYSEDPTRRGIFVRATDAASGRSSALFTLNGGMADVKWGEKMLVDYLGDEGEKLHAGVILPPDYVPGRKYPTLLWVYAGSVVNDLSYRYFEYYVQGFYNLNLYAARGYVVLIPSMPTKRDLHHDDYIDLPKGVMPAVSKLVELGISDPDRLAVMGQSYGGYSVYSLLTYTNRFKAGIAMAGITDLVSLYGQFDPTARDFPGIEHEKSDNWGMAENIQLGMDGPPYENMWRYWRNSPINFVDRVNTPLLMIHGEQDIRGAMPQAEQFFFNLYRQGKTARLVRYWGEDHGLRESPANARSIYGEIVGWLDKYIGSGATARPK